MTLPSISSLTPGPRIADTADAAPRAAAAKVEPTEEQRRVAQEFEAIFMRQLLGSMEKSGGIAGGGKDHGAAMYRSMMVGAIADNAAQAGGIGLSEMVLKAMLPPTTMVAPRLGQSPSPAPSLAPARPEAALLHQATATPRADQRPPSQPALGPAGVMPALPQALPAGRGSAGQRPDMSADFGLVPQRGGR
jgi:peptidoglycan hydrolase FlgJ